MEERVEFYRDVLSYMTSLQIGAESRVKEREKGVCQVGTVAKGGRG